LASHVYSTQRTHRRQPSMAVFQCRLNNITIGGDYLQNTKPHLTTCKRHIRISQCAIYYWLTTTLKIIQGQLDNITKCWISYKRLESIPCGVNDTVVNEQMIMSYRVLASATTYTTPSKSHFKVIWIAFACYNILFKTWTSITAICMIS